MGVLQRIGLAFGISSLLEISALKIKQITNEYLKETLSELLETNTWITNKIIESRAKDYHNPYRKMIYDTVEEMDKVTGKFSDNSFINEQKKGLKNFNKMIGMIKKSL